MTAYYVATWARYVVVEAENEAQARRNVEMMVLRRDVDLLARALLALQHAIADKLVLSKLRERVGLDQMLLAVSGAAPVSPDALKFFISLGLPMAEGWGMSESCLVGTLTPLEHPRPGTVGKPLPGVEVRIADDGELLVKSAGVMRGYRNSPAQTAEAIDPEGWLHTGDVATIDQDGYVAIVDRKKELIINAAGKNMSPTNIEAAIQVECGLIGSVIAIGDLRPYVTALVCLDPEASAGIDDAAALAQVEAAVERANAGLSRVEQIKRFKIVPNTWEPGGHELTPTMKLKRKPIAEKYSDLIDELYATDDRRK